MLKYKCFVKDVFLALTKAVVYPITPVKGLRASLLLHVWHLGHGRSEHLWQSGERLLCAATTPGPREPLSAGSLSWSCLSYSSCYPTAVELMIGPAKLGPHASQHPDMVLAHPHPQGGVSCSGFGLVVCPPLPCSWLGMGPGSQVLPGFVSWGALNALHTPAPGSCQSTRHPSSKTDLPQAC